MAAQSAYVSNLRKIARFVARMSRCVLSAMDKECLSTSAKLPHNLGKVAYAAVPQMSRTLSAKEDLSEFYCLPRKKEGDFGRSY
eukprot:UN22917